VSNRAVLTGYLTWMAALAVASFAWPDQHVFIWTAIGISSVTAMLVGIRRNRPRRAGPWYLLTAAVASLILGDVTADILVRVFDQPDPFPSIADVFYLTMYVLIAAGIVGLYRLGVVRRDAAGVLDALTLTAGITLITWVYLIGPYVENPELTGLQKAISIAYPLGDLLGLAVGASLVASMRATPALRLLAVGGVGLLCSDIAYGIIQLDGTWQVGTPVDLGWIALYTCWGAAALHPSMRELTEPKVLRRQTERRRRLVLLGLACLMAPTVLLVEVLTGEVRDGLTIAVLSAVLSILVLVRLGRAIYVHQRAVDRERGLRRAGAALLTATDPAAVSTVVTDAVTGLLPPGGPHRVVLDIAETSEDDETPDSQSPGEPILLEPRPGLAPEAPATAMVYTKTLPRETADRMGPFEVTLRCALPAEGGTAGTLYIAASETSLVALQEAAQVLAAQAGLTLQRIALSREVDQRNSEAYFRTLVLNTADVILVVDAADRIKYASPSAANLFEADDLRGAALPHLVGQASIDEVRRRMERVRAGEPDQRGVEWHVNRPSAGEALVEASCRDLRGEATVDGLVITLRDVTESRRMQDELYRRATYDRLTGLPNREVFLVSAQVAIDRAVATGQPAGVLVTELDEFRMVNNTMGHGAGDELLAMVGSRLSSALRATGLVAPADRPELTVARSGGDEFAACLSGISSEADIQRTVTAVMDCFDKPFVLSQGAVTVTASVGVAMASETTDSRELLRQADLAVTVAKDAGRGRSLQYEASLHAAVADRLRLRSDLEQAVADGDFVLEFQPIVKLATRRTAGFEALVRWNHPTRGRLAPGEFIGLAEDSGLIVPLGNWVLHHAIEAAAGWQRERGGLGPYISVNVSARQLRTPGFMDLVRSELAASGLPPGRLTLEITESLLIRGGGVGDELAALRADGVRIAIDDFGTGFSSLSYLRQLPVDVLKLDKSFTDTVTSSSEQYAIINAVTQLAETLHLEIVAEGIETDQEAHVLSAMGCGFGQGYLLARPMSYVGAVRWLRDEIAVPATRGRTSP
jgi:diguanylate cyclase (GGDEF)-like protein/PAS domain S-box-containing protein